MGTIILSFQNNVNDEAANTLANTGSYAVQILRMVMGGRENMVEERITVPTCK